MYRPIIIALALSALGAKVIAIEETASTEADGGARSALTKRLLDRDPAQVLSNTHEALLSAERSGNSAAIHVALVNKADEERVLGLNTEFLQTAQQALDLARTMQDPKLIPLDLQNLSMAFLKNQRHEEAAQEARNALAFVLSSKDPEGIVAAERFLVHTYVAVGKVQEALALAQQHGERLRQSGNDIAIARNMLQQGQILIASGKAKEALELLENATAKMDQFGSAVDRFEVRIQTAKAHIAQNDADRATANMRAAQQQLPEIGNNNAAALRRLSYEIALVRGAWQEALGLLQKIDHHTDSVENSREDLRMNALHVLYNSDNKAKRNEELAITNAKNEAIISGQRSSNRVLLGICILVGIMFIALLFTSRSSIRYLKRSKLANQVMSKQKAEIEAKNEELTLQNQRYAQAIVREEEKSLMLEEIHHRVKNNLKVIGLMLSQDGAASSDANVKRFCADVQGRINAMSSVHDAIKHCWSDAAICTKEHFSGLIKNILVSHGVHDRISVNVHSDVPLFEERILMPLSLMVNEMVTLSIDSALGGEGIDHLDLKIRANSNGNEMVLKTNSGIGSWPLGSKEERLFGEELLRSLTIQLNGELTDVTDTCRGYRFVFPDVRTHLKIAS